METKIKGKIKVTKNTFLKPSSRQVSETPNHQLVSVKEGDIIDFEALDSNHFSHYCFESLKPLNGFKRWYIFQGHAQLLTDTTPIPPSVATPIVNNELVEIKGVPFLAQYDNDYAASSSCFLTCISMVLLYLGHKPTNPKIQLEDELFIKALDTNINRFDGYSLVKLIEGLGYKASYTKTATTLDLKTNIKNNIPCILGTYMTSAGHIICLTGYSDKNKYYLAHDPWGKCIDTDNYNFDEIGNSVIYSYDLINRLGSPESITNPQDFWLMTINNK